MRLEDLQIGDWIWNWDAEDVKHPYQVTRETFSLSDYDIANLEPIHITREFLKKNGFEFGDGTVSITCPDESGVIQHTFTFRLLVKIWDENIVSGLRYNIFESNYVDIEDVHDLQHLLRTLYVNDDFKIVV